jgi:hypothetical protein
MAGTGESRPNGRRWWGRVTFTDDDKATARALLKACPVPRDRLPYTSEFEQLWLEFNRQSRRECDMPRDVFWRLLSSAAKQGGLARHRRRRPREE